MSATRVPPASLRPGAADNLRGILFLAIALFGFVANDVCTKIVGPHLGAFQVMGLRGVVGIGLALVFAGAAGAIRLPALLHPLVLLRGLVDASLALLVISALSELPLSEVTVLLQAAPLVLTALSAFWLREAVGWRRWLAVAVGFLGVVIVVRPAFETVSAWTLAVLLAAGLVAVRDVLARQMPAGIQSWSVTLTAMVIVTAIGWAGVAATGWRPVPAGDWVLLAVAGAAIMLASQFMVMAFRNVEISVVSPFRYVVVLWALLMGYLVWGEVLEPHEWLGAAVIVGAGLYTLHRETLRRGG